MLKQLQQPVTQQVQQYVYAREVHPCQAPVLNWRTASNYQQERGKLCCTLQVLDLKMYSVCLQLLVLLHVHGHDPPPVI